MPRESGDRPGSLLNHFAASGMTPGRFHALRRYFRYCFCCFCECICAGRCRARRSAALSRGGAPPAGERHRDPRRGHRAQPGAHPAGAAQRKRRLHREGPFRQQRRLDGARLARLRRHRAAEHPDPARRAAAERFRPLRRAMVRDPARRHRAHRGAARDGQRALWGRRELRRGQHRDALAAAPGPQPRGPRPRRELRHRGGAALWRHRHGTSRLQRLAVRLRVGRVPPKQPQRAEEQHAECALGAGRGLARSAPGHRPAGLAPARRALRAAFHRAR